MKQLVHLVFMSNKKMAFRNWFRVS